MDKPCIAWYYLFVELITISAKREESDKKVIIGGV